jgi:hypothetical protein
MTSPGVIDALARVLHLDEAERVCPRGPTRANG